jgi:hypothetical protein
VIRTVSILVALAGTICCADATAPAAPCNGPIDVTVSTAATPTISWTPACGISLLTVSAVTALPESETVWGLTVSEQHPIGPAITYGDNPRGADVWVQPQSLAVGQQYRVWVAYTVGGDVIVASGSALFTWFPPD